MQGSVYGIIAAENDGGIQVVCLDDVHMFGCELTETGTRGHDVVEGSFVWEGD